MLDATSWITSGFLGVCSYRGTVIVDKEVSDAHSDMQCVRANVTKQKFAVELSKQKKLKQNFVAKLNKIKKQKSKLRNRNHLRNVDFESLSSSDWAKGDRC